MISFLFWYVIISYLLGFVIFAIEVNSAIKKHQYFLVNMGIVILLLSPLTTWHGVLHYVQLGWSKLTKRPLKFWI